MTAELKFGLKGILRFEDGGGTQFTNCQRPLTPLEDLAAAVEQTLTHPLEFPPLAQAILPGDTVTLALDAHVPQGLAVAKAVIDLLVRWGVAAQNITLLVASSPDEIPSPTSLNGSAVVVHDPAKRDEMAYLAATPAGEALYLNRVLSDADVVIPIAGVQMHARGAKAADGLYPIFSDAKIRAAREARQRKRSGPGRRQREAIERPDVCWLLGVPCLVQVVPGPGGSVLNVLAGEPTAARRESRRQCEAAWSFPVPHAASLVVAAVEGDVSQQSWEQVGRALAAATQAVAEDGAIALCCDLAQEPGPAVRALAEGEDRHDTLKAIRRARLPDAQVAARLARACDRATVYLLSRLDEDLVEQLGLARIQEPAEVARLARRHESCLLLANAQHARAILQE